jgi:predicted amidophosphoribosyltransferase
VISPGRSRSTGRDQPETEQRQKLLAGAHSVDAAKVKGRKVLLFDDLFLSGATMNAVADVLLKKGGASKVFALTLTRTRSSR